MRPIDYLQKEKQSALESKRCADKFWKKTYESFKKKESGISELISAMEYTNSIDREIIKKYGYMDFIGY